MHASISIFCLNFVLTIFDFSFRRATQDLMKTGLIIYKVWVLQKLFLIQWLHFRHFFLTYNFYTRKIDLRRTCLFWGFSSNLKDKRVLKFNLYLPTIEFCCWTDYFNQTFIISMFMTIIHKFTFVKTVFLFRYIEILMSLYYYILCILNDKLTW